MRRNDGRRHGSDKKRRHRLQRAKREACRQREAEGRREISGHSLSLSLFISVNAHNTHVDLVHRTRLNAKSHERVTRCRGEERKVATFVKFEDIKTNNFDP